MYSYMGDLKLSSRQTGSHQVTLYNEETEKNDVYICYITAETWVNVPAGVCITQINGRKLYIPIVACRKGKE